jgi:hypothetical protein
MFVRLGHCGGEGLTEDEFAAIDRFCLEAGITRYAREEWSVTRDERKSYVADPKLHVSITLSKFDGRLQVQSFLDHDRIGTRRRSKGSREYTRWLSEDECATRLDSLAPNLFPGITLVRSAFRYVHEPNKDGTLSPFVQDECGGATGSYTRHEPEGPCLGGAYVTVTIDSLDGSLLHFSRSPVDTEVTSRVDNIGEARAREIATTVALREFGVEASDFRSKVERGFTWPGDHPGNELAVRPGQPFEARLAYRFVFYEAGGYPGRWKNLFVTIDAATGKCMGAFMLEHPG